MTDLIRVVVDPNSAIPNRPGISPALLEEASAVPAAGDSVIAAVPDTGGTEERYPGVVESVDLEHGLVFVRVDWMKHLAELVGLAEPLSSYVPLGNGVYRVPGVVHKDAITGRYITDPERLSAIRSGTAD